MQPCVQSSRSVAVERADDQQQICWTVSGHHELRLSLPSTSGCSFIKDNSAFEKHTNKQHRPASVCVTVSCASTGCMYAMQHDPLVFNAIPQSSIRMIACILLIMVIYFAKLQRTHLRMITE